MYQKAFSKTTLEQWAVLVSVADEGGVAQVAVVVRCRVPLGFLGDRLRDGEFIAVARSDHPLLRIDHTLTLDDLTRHVQAVGRDSGSTEPRDDGWLGADHRYTVSSMESSLGLVLAGLAYAWLPEHVLANHLRDGVLRRIPLAGGGSRTVTLHIVMVRPELAGPAATAARATVKSHASSPLGGATPGLMGDSA